MKTNFTLFMVAAWPLLFDHYSLNYDSVRVLRHAGYV